jgi:PST family polysaccharide transporter
MIKMILNNHSETISNVFWRGLQLVVKDGISLVIFILAAKILHPYEFGVYNYVLAVIFFLILFGDFGISVAASKYVAEYQATDPKKLKYVLFNAGLIILVLTILVAALIASLGSHFFSDKYLYILYVIPLIFLAPMTSLYDGIYRGLRQFRKLALLSTTVGVISIGFIYFMIREYGLIGAILSQNFYYLSLFMTLALCYRDFVFKLNREILRSVGFYAIVIGIIHVSAFLYTRVDILVLGFFDLVVEIGYYEIVNKVLMLMQLPFLVYAQVQAPNMVTYYYQEGSLAILKKLSIYVKYATAVTMFLVVFMVLTIPWFLQSFLNKYYLPGVILILNIYLFIFIFQNVSNLVGNTFIISTGHARINMINIIIFGILNLVLDIFLVHIYGYIGIAYAKLIVAIVASLSLIILYRHALKKNIEDPRRRAVGESSP